MNTNTFPETACHCGMTPFIDASGIKMGCYQQINKEGKAIATVTFYGDKIEQFYALPSSNRGEFLKQALALFNSTQAINFLN